MWKNLPLWARHLVLLFASIVVGVFPGQYLAANTAAHHRSAPALTATFYTLSVVGVIASIVMVIIVLASVISDRYSR